VEEVSQETIASEEASSEYYDTIAPGFVGFYPENFGYDSYGEGDWIATDKNKKLMVEYEGKRYEFTSRFAFDVLNGRPQKEWEDTIAQEYCNDLLSEFTNGGYACDVAEEFLPPVTKVEFVEVRHPREYNFANDRIKIRLHVTSKEDFTAWANRYTEKNWEDWARLLKDLFTSHSGFYSWYSNDPLVWAEQTKHYTDVGGLGEWPRQGSESVCVETLLKLFLWKESKLIASYSGELEQPKFWDSFQGRFEMSIIECVGSPTECNGDGFSIKTNTLYIPKDEAYKMDVLKENHNTASWKLLEEEE